MTHQRVQLREVAEAAGISYREFRELNPAYRRTWVPRGTHRFVLPHQGVDGLAEAVDGVKLASRKRGEAFLEQPADPEVDLATEGEVDAPESGLTP